MVIYFNKSGMTLNDLRYTESKIVSWRICIVLRLAIGGYGWDRRNLQKTVSFRENVIFRGFDLSLGHFGQQGPESPVSQLQNGASTSSLPPFI